MEEQNITVQEAVELLLMSQSSVYSWIEKGKLKTIDSPTGKLIVISNKEIETIREFNLKSKRNKVSKQNTTNSDNFRDFPVIDAEYSRNDEVLLSSAEKFEKAEKQTSALNYSAQNFSATDKNPRQYSQSEDVNLYLVKQLEKYALDAGQFKQLEIIRKQEKDDLEHWKNEYYALKSADIAEIARLQAAIEAKDNEISALKKQIELLKADEPKNSQTQKNPSPEAKNPQNSGGIKQAIKKFFTNS